MLRYFQKHYYSSGLVIQGYIKSSTPQHSTNQIIAEIDFEVNSESRLRHSVGEEDDSIQEANQAQCLKTPETVTAAEREARSLIRVPFRSWCTVGQRAKGQQHYHKSKQEESSVIQLDHSVYKVHGKVENLKLTFVETVTSTSGAVVVPDLSAHQVAIKALKKPIAVNGFTKSVLQYGVTNWS